MPDRLIPRREVLAFVALTSTEEHAPHNVRFREYTRNGKERHVITLAVDTVEAVRFWAETFGHGKYAYNRVEWTEDARTRVANHYSQDDGWRSFTTEVEATVRQTPDVPLDDTTREQVAELAGEPS